MTITSNLRRCALAVAAAFVCGAAAQAADVQQSEQTASRLQPIDRIVCVVNNDVITEYDLQMRDVEHRS